MVAGFVIVAVLDAINRIYDSYPIAKDRPIKVFVQVIKIFVISAIIITIVSEFIGSPLVIYWSGWGRLLRF